jgi:hypothetical protein
VTPYNRYTRTRPIVNEDNLDCPECGLCWTPARVDEQKSDGSFGPGPYIRCVGCKSDYHRPMRVAAANAIETDSPSP